MGHVYLFGSLSFPAVILRIQTNQIFTMQNSPIRLFGIPRKVAEDYLKRIGKSETIDLTTTAGMSSCIAHEVHPLCFQKSLAETFSLIQIGTELKSYYFILQATLRSPEMYKLLTTLYTQGWYAYIGEGYSDADIIDAYKKNRLPISACLKLLCSLGFIKKYEKTINEDSLMKLHKSRRALPSPYYSFSNVILYYSFTYFIKKISRSQDEIFSSLPFVTKNLEQITELCEEFLEKNARFSLEENRFVDKIYFQFMNMFPTYLAVLRFIVDEDKQYNLDLGLFAFDDALPTYVWEFKLTDSCQKMLTKDHEAIHQIYCRQYHKFIRRIDSKMSEKQFKERLQKMFLITYVTDAEKFVYTNIRKFNEKLVCQCVNPEKRCRDDYPSIKSTIGSVRSSAGRSEVESQLLRKRKFSESGDKDEGGYFC